MIMPQEIRIDDFHGPLHAHPPGEEAIHEPISEGSMASVREIIRRHVERRQTVNYEELREELR